MLSSQGQKDEIETGVKSLLAALKECGRSRDLQRAKQLHTQALYCGQLSNKYVSSSLITAYSKCRSSIDARAVFDNMIRRDVVACNALLQCYLENGQAQLAIDLFHSMEEPSWRDCLPNARTFVAALTACASLATSSSSSIRSSSESERLLGIAKGIHSRSLTRRCCDIFVETALIHLFSKCGSMAEARSVFDGMASHDVVSWNALLQGYVDNGENDLALELFDGMNQKSCEPDARTYLAALAACAALGGLGSSRGLERGIGIHSRALASNCCDAFVENVLVDMYSKCGSMLHARRIFDAMARKDVVAWTALLHGYAENGDFEIALNLFDRMQKNAGGGGGSSSSSSPVARTYVAALKACAGLAAKDGWKGLEWLEKGKTIGSRAADSGCCDVFVKNMLLDLCVKHGRMIDAMDVFEGIRKDERDSVSWNVLLDGYVQVGESLRALELFDGMEDGVANARTYAVAIAACAALALEEKDIDSSKRSSWLEKGESVRDQALNNHCCDSFVETAFVNMFAKSGRFVDAHRAFQTMAEKTIVAWNCLIQGYVGNGRNEEALLLFASLISAGGGIEANSVTFVHAIAACSNLVDVEAGKSIHGQALRLGLFDREILVETSLVDFYSRCGSMKVAEYVFEGISAKDTVAWNALLCGYSLQGDAEQVFDFFAQMEELSVAPNDVTFLCLLAACSHAGMSDKADEYFKSMVVRYGIKPSAKHCSCMVDLLCRENKLEEALEMVRSMEEANVVTWQTLLGGCAKLNNVVIGKVAYESLLKLNGEDSAAYVLMANTYQDSQENVLARS